MKKAIILLVLAGFALTQVGCKKGENDPFLSLKSRKARLVGEWEYDTGDLVDIIEFDDQRIEMELTEDDYEEKYTFNKDNTYEIETEYSYTFEYNNGYYQFDYDVTVKQNEKGTWSFGSKNKELDLKNKEYVILCAEEIDVDSKQIYDENVYERSYKIEFEGTGLAANTYFLILDQLSNKEMTIKFENKHLVEDVDGYIEKEEVEGELTYTKK